MIVDTIEAIVKTLSKPVGFFYANLYEVNLDLDKYKGTEEIFFVYVTPENNSDTIGDVNDIHTKFPLVFFMMKKNEIHVDTTDYTSIEVEPIVQEMLELSREFIHRLNHADIVEKNSEFGTGITEVTYNHEYAWQDIHVFGVSGICDVPIYEGKTGCRPARTW